MKSDPLPTTETPPVSAEHTTSDLVQDHVGDTPQSSATETTTSSLQPNIQEDDKPSTTSPPVESATAVTGSGDSETKDISDCNTTETANETQAKGWLLLFFDEV